MSALLQRFNRLGYGVGHKVITVHFIPLLGWLYSWRIHTHDKR